MVCLRSSRVASAELGILFLPFTVWDRMSPPPGPERRERAVGVVGEGRVRGSLEVLLLQGPGRVVGESEGAPPRRSVTPGTDKGDAVEVVNRSLQVEWKTDCQSIVSFPIPAPRRSANSPRVSNKA